MRRIENLKLPFGDLEVTLAVYDRFGRTTLYWKGKQRRAGAFLLPCHWSVTAHSSSALVS